MAASVVIFLTLLEKLGINTNIKRLIGLSQLAKNEPDFKINRVYGFKIIGGIAGYIKFFTDIDVVNKTQSDILISNLQIVAYNERNDYIGQSLPYNRDVIIHENSTGTIQNIEVHVDFAKALFGYGLPALQQIVMHGNKEKLGRKILLDVSLEINGLKINKKEIIEI